MVFPHQLCTTYLVQFRLDRHCARWHSGHDGHFNPPNQQLHDCGDLDSQRCCWSFAQRFLQPRVSWFHCLRFLPLHWDLLDVLDGVNHVWCERAELGFHQHHEALDLPGIGGDMGDIDSQWITVVLLCIIAANLSNHEKSWLHVVKCTQMYLDSHMVHWPSWKACTCRVPSSWVCAARCNANLLRSIIFFVATRARQPCQVRPENPAEYSHDYMKQSQWVTGYQCWKLSGVFLTSPWCFPTETGQRIRGSCRYSPLVFWGRCGEVERNGLSALFRIPGILPSYDTDSGQDCRRVCHDVYWWLQLFALQWSTMLYVFLVWSRWTQELINHTISYMCWTQDIAPVRSSLSLRLLYT